MNFAPAGTEINAKSEESGHRAVRGSCPPAW
jgi:hypothetical protein